jgi:hypothetical protein
MEVNLQGPTGNTLERRNESFLKNDGEKRNDFLLDQRLPAATDSGLFD